MHFDLFEDNDEDYAIMYVVENELLNDNDDEDDGQHQRIAIDLEGWRRLNNSTFKENFRMDRCVFQRLVVAIGRNIQSKALAENRNLRRRTPLDVKIMMGIWTIFNPDTYRSAAPHFGKNKSVIYHCYKLVIESLRELAHHYIKWPTELQRDIIKATFEEKYGYPGVVGCIDGVLIRITAPLEQPARYYQRERHPCITVQAVCDNKLLYRDLYVGEVGSVGDARNFERSPLSLNLLSRQDMISDDEHLLGDGAYTLSSKMMKPYQDDGHLTAIQRTHNHILSKCRSSIERSFALLKGRNRRLKLLHMRNIHRTIDHIVACFVLHNFILLEGHIMEGLPSMPMALLDPAELQRRTDLASEGGILKREYIANLLHRGG